MMLLPLLMNLGMFGSSPTPPVTSTTDTHDAPPPWIIQTRKRPNKKRIRQIVEEIEAEAPEPMKEAVAEIVSNTPDWGLIANDIQAIDAILDIYGRMLRDREVAQLLALDD